MDELLRVGGGAGRMPPEGRGASKRRRLDVGEVRSVACTSMHRTPVLPIMLRASRRPMERPMSRSEPPLDRPLSRRALMERGLAAAALVAIPATWRRGSAPLDVPADRYGAVGVSRDGARGRALDRALRAARWEGDAVARRPDRRRQRAARPVHGESGGRPLLSRALSRHRRPSLVGAGGGRRPSGRRRAPRDPC